MDDLIVTKIQPYHIKHVNMSGVDGHENEIMALSRLSNCECICGKGPHFPKIIDRNDEINKLTMSYVGKSLNNNSRELYDYIENGNSELIDKQCECISRSLAVHGVRHVDQSRTGQNLCFSNETLYVIDFAISAFDSGDDIIWFKTKKIRSWLSNYGFEKNTYMKTYYNQLKCVINLYKNRIKCQKDQNVKPSQTQ